MQVNKPDSAFYLWAQVNISDKEFARGLYEKENVAVLPGGYLWRESGGIKPGAGHVRMALVAPLDECVDAAKRIRDFIER